MNKYSNKTMEELQKDMERISKRSTLEYTMKPDLLLDDADVIEALAYKMLENADEARKAYKMVTGSRNEVLNHMKRIFGFDDL